MKKLQSIEKTQKEYGSKAGLAPCKLSFVNQTENLQEIQLYINDNVKRIE